MHCNSFSRGWKPCRRFLSSVLHLVFFLAVSFALALGLPSSTGAIGMARAALPGALGAALPACDPSNQSCTSGPGTPVAEPSGTASCGPGAGGATACGSGPATMGNQSGTNQGAGNPINVINGNKTQREEDMPALPGVLGLEIVRHYNSAYSTPQAASGIVGRGWKLSYETDLYVIGRTIQILQADGTRVIFQRDPDHPGNCSTADPANGQLRIARTRRGEEYTWTWRNGRTLLFTSDGKLVQIAVPTGEFVSLQRDHRGILQQVTDPQGRQLRLQYPDRATASANRSFRGVVTITGPLGVYGYRYGSALPPDAATKTATAVTNRATTDAANVRANLVSVSYPVAGTGRLYHYEDARHPTLLSGISLLEPISGEPAARRIGTYLYDRDGRAILTVRGMPARLQTGQDDKPIAPARLVEGTGIGQVTLDFSGPGATIASNSLGQKTVYRHAIVAGEFRLLEVRGAGCQDCGETNVRYGYDRLGRLTETTRLRSDGMLIAATRTVRDASGRPLSIQQIDYRDGQPQPPRMLVRYEYGPIDKPGSGNPRLIARPSVVPGKEHRLEVAYNAFGQPTRVTETGHDPVLEIGQIKAQTANGTVRTTDYQYQTINGRSVLAQIAGPLRNSPAASANASDNTRFTWSHDGARLEKIVYPTGGTASFAYEPAATGGGFRLVRSTAVDGVMTELKYDASGAVAQVIRAGAVTRYLHDASGRMTQGVSPNGQDLQYTYDHSREVAAITDRQNNRIRLIHNAEGDLLEAQFLDPDGKTAQQPRRFEQASVRTGSGSGAGDAVLKGIRRLIASAKDADNVGLARPDLAVSPYQVLQEFTAGAAIAADAPPRRALDITTDANGFVTSTLTNDFGNLVSVQSPITGNVSYRYDLAGRLLGKTLADGSHADYTRDAAGRIVSVKAFDAQNHRDEDASISWGRADKPVLIRYAAGEEHFDYDAAARLTSHVQTIDGKRYTLHYRYDSTGNLIEKSLPDGQVLAYRYQGAVHPRAGLLESVWLKQFGSGILDRTSGGMLDRPIVQGMNDEADNYRHRSFQFGNGLSNAITLDMEGRIVSAGNIEVGQTRLRYDGGNHPEGSTTLHPISIARQADRQVAQALSSQLHGALVQWRGSPTEQSPILLGLQATDHAAPERRFDAHGRQTRDGATQYRYDSLDRLTGIDRTIDGVTREVATYRHNLFGQRIAKTMVLADGKSTRTTHYFYDGSHLVFEGDANASPSSDANANTKTSGAVAVATGAVVAKQYVWLNDTPIALLQQGGLFSIHTDHRNAPLAVTDEARRVVWQANVADFLHASPANGPAFGQISFNLRGSNQYFDAESGLHYNTHRYFDPIARRYLTPDPLGLAAGPDLYAFALNRPHVMSDPLGLAPVKTDADVGTAAFPDKLTYVFGEAAKKLPGAVGQALLDLVSPQNIATTAGVLALWGGAHVIGVGFIADIALAGMAYYSLGAAAIDFVRGVLSIVDQISSARCLNNLSAAASTLLSTTNILVMQSAGRGKTGSEAIGAIFGGGKAKLPPGPPAAIPPGGRALVLHPTTIPKIAKDLTDEAVAAGKLVKNGVNDWISAGGLRYIGTDRFHKNRIEHVADHLTVNSAKPSQSIFAIPPNKLLATIDEAWIKSGVNRVPVTKTDTGTFIVKMDRAIGVNGETHIRIVTKPGSKPPEVISAYPYIPMPGERIN